MDFIEFTGKTVDDALTNALVEFGVKIGRAHV